MKHAPVAGEARVSSAGTNGSSKTADMQAAVSGGIAQTERRRTQRVLLRVRANIHVTLQGKATTLQASTLSVHPQGALVLMNRRLAPETRLVLEHSGTRERVACKVGRAPREMPEGFQIPIEFDAPAPDFWKIDFPPADWRPEDL